MRALIDQIDGSLSHGSYFLSLYTSLTVPDIAGAFSSDSGEASQAKYASWFEAWVRPRFFEAVLADLPPQHREHVKPIENPLTGEACYRFRCSLLHQGSPQQHPKSSLNRIIFIEPGATTSVIHYAKFNDAICINLMRFCREMVAGARLWLEKAEHEPNYIKNYERFARRHERGLLPYIGGVPVIG